MAAPTPDQPRRSEKGVTDGTRTQFASRERTDFDAPLNAGLIHDHQSADEILDGMRGYEQRQLARHTTDLDKLHILAWSSEWHVADVAINRPDTREDTLISIIDHGTRPHRLLVADTDPIRPRVARLLADVDDGAVRAAVAENHSTPAEVLVFLAEDPNALVAAAAGGNPFTPANTLTELAGEDDDVICTAVAANPATPVPVLEKLIRSRYPRVVAAAALNPLLPPRLQLELAGSSEPQVLIALSRRPNLHHSTHRDLLGPQSDETVRAAVDSIEFPWRETRRR